MAGPIGDEGDQARGAACRPAAAAHLVEQIADHRRHVDIAHLVAAADIVALADPALRAGSVDSARA